MSICTVSGRVAPTGGTAMPGYGFGRCAAHSDEIIRAVSRAVRDGYRYADSAAMRGNEARIRGNGDVFSSCRRTAWCA